MEYVLFVSFIIMDKNMIIFPDMQWRFNWTTPETYIVLL